ncbi:MAG: PBP1A family penicillin-binding protein [Clostridia bacterium]
MAKNANNKHASKNSEEKGFFSNLKDQTSAFFKRTVQKVSEFFAVIKNQNGNLDYTDTRTISMDKNALKSEKLFVKNDEPRSFALSVVFTTLKVLMIVLVFAIIAGAGLVLGVAKAYVDTTPSLDVEKLTDTSLTSYIYDCNGELITTFAGMEYREWASIDEIPDMLKNAVVAIEDVRFYKHGGVDYKRLVSAIINTLRNTDTHGGSTITQQLIKNTILTNVQSYKRKIQEAYLATELESVSDKDKILEAYLNVVYLGDKNYGVKSAAKDFFGKDLNDLTIRECAMLAGMIQKPNGYNPRANTYTRIDPETGKNDMERTNARTDIVIRAMYNACFITLDQMKSALGDNVHIVEVSTKTDMYDIPYFVEYGIYDVITSLLYQRDVPDTSKNRSIIEDELRTGGYKIYLTVDTNIQKTVQECVENYSNYPKLRDPSKAIRYEKNADGSVTEIIEPQAAAVVIDYHTGELKAIVGGRTEPERKKEWNRAYMSALPVGSAIKPISVYGPALDLGVSPATIMYNIPGAIEGYGGKGFPSIGQMSTMGPVTVRRGLRSSLNIVAARLLFEKVGLEKSFEYMKNLGIAGDRINKDGPGLALGTSTITPIEMAAAYATIGNGGVYNDPTSFTRVVDSNGSIILDSVQVKNSRRVFKESTAYMLVDMMEDAVNSGTGTAAQISGMTVAGKTGTNSDYSSVYFAGMTPYYVSTVWIGHDYPSNVLANSASGGTYAAPLFKNFMQKIHEGLPDKAIIDANPSELGLKKYNICAVSGLLATPACALDKTYPPVSDWFLDGTQPKDFCNMHKAFKICDETGAIATAFCPLTHDGALLLISPKSGYNQFNKEYLNQLFPFAIYMDIALDKFTGEGYFCNVHTTTVDPIQALIAEAQALISTVRTYLDNPTTMINDHDRHTLENAILRMRAAILMAQENFLRTAIDNLRSNYERIAALGGV